jgi:deoxyribonuclease-4
LYIGAHVSVAGGFINGLEYAASIGAECMQFFAKSPRQWRGPALDPTRVSEFREARDSTGFGPVFTHTAYLLNLSTTDEVLLERTVVALADELIRCSALGADGVVTHVGNDPAGDDVAAAQRAGSAILRGYDLAGERGVGARLLLENTAGAGSSFGASFEQLAATIRATNMDPDRIGVCLDTCHGFAYGMPLDTAEGWHDLIAEMDATVGLDRLGLIHANDCMFERGSKRDRHAWIGDGHIGVEGFLAMVCAPELQHVPVVTEMPGEAPEKDVVNLERLMAMREECSPSHLGSR